MNSLFNELQKDSHIGNLFQNSDATTTLLMKTENPIAKLIENSERIFLKIYLICFILIVAKIILFYAILKIKKWLYGTGKDKKNIKEDPYKQFEQNKSILGFCIDYNVKNIFGKLGESEVAATTNINTVINVGEIKNKLSYYMQHRLLSRENVITLVTYLENFAPKEKGKKYKNDLHYLHSALKYQNIDPKVLKCFSDLMDELAIPRLLDVCTKAEKTHQKVRAEKLSNDKNIVDFMAYKKDKKDLL